MNIIKDVKSQNKPIEIDDISSSTTVFIRRNVKEIEEIDPVFITKSIMYVYDEYQYTHQEWNKLIMDSIKQDGEMIQTQIDITQLAMSELLDLLGSMMVFSEPEEEARMTRSIKSSSVLKNKYTAITIMYAGMIKRKLITIDKVSEPYRENVLQYLEETKEEE